MHMLSPLLMLASHSPHRAIDPISNLAGQNIYIYSGQADSVVNPGVVKKLEEFYRNYIKNAS